MDQVRLIRNFQMTNPTKLLEVPTVVDPSMETGDYQVKVGSITRTPVKI